MGMSFPTLLTPLCPSPASILHHPTTMKTAGRQWAHQGSCIIHGTEISKSHSKFTETVMSPLCAPGGWHLTLSHSQTNPVVFCAQRWYTDLKNSRQQEQTTRAFAFPFPANPTRVSEPGPANQQFPSLLRLKCHLWRLLTALDGGQRLQSS